MSAEQTTPRLVVEVWSDIMCPFCYMGHMLLAAALRRFAHTDEVEVRYRSYQLMPHLPPGRAVEANELLVREKGLPLAQVQAMNDQIAERGRTLGIDYRFDQVLAVNTRAAHHLTHFALREGRQPVLMHRLFQAYFTEGLDLGRPEELVALAADVGLDREAAMAALSDPALEEAVRADQQRAGELGITGVPFFVFGETHAVSGAQPEAVFDEALQAAWAAAGG